MHVFSLGNANRSASGTRSIKGRKEVRLGGGGFWLCSESITQSTPGTRLMEVTGGGGESKRGGGGGGGGGSSLHTAQRVTKRVFK